MTVFLTVAYYMVDDHMTEKFLYALWRDCVLDDTRRSRLSERVKVFLYALWRDCVLDIVALPEKIAGSIYVSIRLMA